MSALTWRELSAGGAGAVRVLALEGPGAQAALARLAGGRIPAADTFALVTLRGAGGAWLDEAVVRVRGPEAVELQVHGSPAVVARLLEELGPPPQRGQGGSLEARAEERLARAESEAAARLLLDQAEGALRRALVELLSFEESARVARARALAARGRQAEALLVPRRVVLAGPVNAGKSTLFNLLVGRERVVVDARAGTTRDAVAERIQLGAYPVELLDTAGRRALAGGAGPEAEVERAGQVLADELARTADLVLELVPPGARAPAPRPGLVLVASRTDEGSPPAGLPGLSVHADPAGARATVERLFHGTLGLSAQPWLAGEPVPFEPEWCALLARASGAELTAALHAWLAAR